MNRRWVPAAGGAALLLIAWGVSAITPPEEISEQPFIVAAPIGERGEGRNLAVTVTAVRTADAVTGDGWRAEGEWLVFDLEAESLQSEDGVLLEFTQLQLGDRSYQASERPPDSMRLAPLSLGIPRAGSLAFELPEGALDDGGADEVVLHLGLDYDERVDSLIETKVRLDRLERVAEAEVKPSDWARE